jgi:hypothetical protein
MRTSRTTQSDGLKVARETPPPRSSPDDNRIGAGAWGPALAGVPALPGCHTCGGTRAELLANLREAVEACRPGPDPARAGPEFLPLTNGGGLEEVDL